ncbi:MAG: 30S ribosomal protein S13 [Nitrospira sp.]|nr:30S ribosomal protein S13 [Nitrospira sp.]
MARIAGVDLPRGKRTDIGLTYIYGIGRAAASKILKIAGVDGATRVKDLSEDKIVKLREILERYYRVEGDLRKEVSLNIKRLIDTGTYRGLRHRKSLPVRGQRSKTNARTRKGRRAGVGSKPKPTAAKAGSNV